MQDKLQIIKDACVKANPSIMELSNGCLMNIWWLDNPKEREADEQAEFTDRTMRDNGGADGYYRQIIEDNVTGTVEVLGRLIRLADVILAIRKSVMENPEKDDAEIYFACGTLINSWNLLKDDLREQSDETISFLANLLK